MDFLLTDRQADLQKMARGAVLASYSTQDIRDTETSAEGFPQSIWEEGVKLGWPGVSIPEAFGGDGGDLLDLCALLEEIGRSGATLPIVASAGVCATILKHLPTSPHRDRCLSAIAAGKIIAPALIDENGRNEWDQVQLPLRSDGTSFRLSGTKMFVPFGANANELLVTAVTDNGDTVILVVDPSAEGVSITRHHSEVGIPLSWITFKDVEVVPDRVLQKGKDAVSAVRSGLRVGALLATAETVGMCEAIKKIAADYVINRQAFGRAIGSFQAVAHPCADMHISIETIRVLTQEAAWLLDTGKDAVEEIESTKALANELFERVANDAFCMHGAEGYAEACDLQLFMRRVRGFCQTLGETQECLERAAQAVGI